MSGVYVVNSVDTVLGTFSCDVFAGFEAASKVAIECAIGILGEDSCYINKNPSEEKNGLGSKWFFVSQDDIFIVVSFEKINSFINGTVSETHTNDLVTPKYITDGYQSPTVTVNPVLPLTIKEKIENLGLDMPAGFSISNKPLTNAELIKYPYQFKSAVKDLTDTQKWALIMAIVKKSPNYSIIIENTRFEQLFSIVELSYKSEIGLKIRDYECSKLDIIRNQMANELYSDLENEF